MNGLQFHHLKIGLSLQKKIQGKRASKYGPWKHTYHTIDVKLNVEGGNIATTSW